MLHERIYLNSEKSAFLDTYALSDSLKKKTSAMLIIPGGGYYRVVSEKEGEPVALAFAAKGMSAFVLTYSTGKDAAYPRPFLDTALAIKHIRENAEKYNVDPNRIFGVGFSAGAHLLGLLTTQFNKAEEMLELPKDYLKLTGSIFAYPVVSAYPETHRASFANLVKKPFAEFTEEDKQFFSVDLNVNSETPPAFIWHTSEDEIVPIDGTLKLAHAYIKAKIPVELHVYPYGPHGISLANEITSAGREGFVQPKAAKWVDEAYEWLCGV